jgi:hypothetical protein
MFGSYTIEIAGGKVSSVGFARSVKIEVVENETKPTAPQNVGNQADNTSEGKTL